MLRQLPIWFFAARLMAASVSIIVLVALLTMPLDANLFYAAVICIAGCLLMGWLELGLRATANPKRR